MQLPTTTTAFGLNLKLHLFVLGIGCILLCFFPTNGLGQVSTGLVIDVARAASTFSIEDEYFSPNHCLVQANQFSAGFNRIARFDLAIANLGTNAFTTNTHKATYDSCAGADTFQTSLELSILAVNAGQLVNYIPQPKGICLEDTSKTTLSFSGTPASSPTYACATGGNGISPGWQTVIDRRSNTMVMSLNNLYNNVNVIKGEQYILQITFMASLFCNCTDVTAQFNFYLPEDPNCYPSPAYTATVLGYDAWADPTFHSSLPGPNGWLTNVPGGTPQINIATQTFGPFLFDGALSFCDAPGSPNTWYIRDNGIVSWDASAFPTTGPEGGNLQSDNVVNGNPIYVERTYFPYWDDVHWINSAQSDVRFYANTTDTIITWMGLDRLSGATGQNVTFQAHWMQNRDVIFTYQSPYQGGLSATVGMCNGPVAILNASVTTNTQSLWNQSTVDNNCNIYSLNQADLSTNMSILFTFTSQTIRALPNPGPYVNLTSPATAEIQTQYTFSAEGSVLYSSASLQTNAVYMWLWDDGSLPTFGVTVNHTFVSVSTYKIGLQIFDGIQWSNITTYSLYVGPIILTNNTKTFGDGGDGTAGYIALAVILPVLFVLILVVLAAVFVVLFLRRHILSSGGAWWEEDPIYLNLEEQQ